MISHQELLKDFHLLRAVISFRKIALYLVSVWENQEKGLFYLEIMAFKGDLENHEMIAGFVTVVSFIVVIAAMNNYFHWL